MNRFQRAYKSPARRRFILLGLIFVFLGLYKVQTISMNDNILALNSYQMWGMKKTIKIIDVASIVELKIRTVDFSTDAYSGIYELIVICTNEIVSAFEWRSEGKVLKVKHNIETRNICNFTNVPYLFLSGFGILLVLIIIGVDGVTSVPSERSIVDSGS